MRDLLEQGVAASKGFAVKAGAKAQDLGERGILMLETKQLEGQAQKLIGRLGAEAYRLFVDEDRPEITRDSAVIGGILSEIARVRDTIEKKEAELRARK
jgi:hypothetical protein